MAQAQTHQKATQHVRLADVAREAGVAISTVSRVFSNPDRVNFQTVERVKTVAARLGYKTRPTSVPADPPRTSGQGLLTLMVKDTSDGISSQILKGAQLAALESDRAVSVIETGRSVKWTEHMLRQLVGKVDGVMLSTDQLNVEVIQQVSHEMPLVVLNRPVEHVPSVVPDPLIGVTRALLLLRRHRLHTITYVCGHKNSWANQSRWECLHDIAIRMGFAIRQIGPVSPNVEGGFQAAIALEGTTIPDAIISYNDLIAAGIVLRLAADGISVPGDVSVIGFDNTLIAPVVTPPITSIRIPRAQIGQTAVNVLLGNKASPALNLRDAELLRYLHEHDIATEPLSENVTRVDTSLIVRHSVAAKHSSTDQSAR